MFTSIQCQSDRVKDQEYSHWKSIFDQFAKSDSNSTLRYLDEQGFIDATAPSNEDFKKIQKSQYSILFKIADLKKTGKVTWDQFVVFQTLLKKPDAEFEVAFKYFDQDSNGEVTFEEFKKVFSDNLGPGSLPFTFESPWVKLFLGKRGGLHVLRYSEFTQLMKGLQGERLRQAFSYFDKAETGHITPEEFKRIILELARHKLSDTVLDRLPTLCTLTSSGKISYSQANAFHNVIREMDTVERILKEAISKSPDGKISRQDFLNTASRQTRYINLTPLEVDIVFHFAGMGDINSRLGLIDFGKILDPKWEPRSEELESEEQLTGDASFWHGVGKSAYNFGLGGIAGALGATAVYPIDLVKTRMQNQRSKVVGELLYKNSLDCVKKVFKNEGFLGFYRGLPPQLIGVAPEKAIKLTINDLIRANTKDPVTGQIALGWELLAGATAGGCQVAVTNPLEIVKIRLQMQGELARVAGTESKGSVHIIKQLGLLGLYKGAGACLCRDIPFSAIYFTAYAHLKKDTFGEGLDGKKLSFLETLSSAAIAGMPAAYLTTPADVVKTRLQSEARKGETTYKGLIHCFRTILKEEGSRALFKGGPARVLRSSPQFGVTLVSYEYLQKLIPYPFGRVDKVEAPVNDYDELPRIRARNAMKILLDVHEDFGAVKRS
ncbi:mitochondrial carrier domain-containing protein [Phakopsora pachyrhizi]|uniref:Mitochondrial aspartate-glutamate transporter AGC1 n=2 Tax=Phakopsora pachyrhizi TaxID=170000 RepID=A0AAV0BHX3_PHAPC|nr:mitochondrial carrier domain-containing protein [Phakopsora pachyrhizi]